MVSHSFSDRTTIAAEQRPYAAARSPAVSRPVVSAWAGLRPTHPYVTTELCPSESDGSPFHPSDRDRAEHFDLEYPLTLPGLVRLICRVKAKPNFNRKLQQHQGLGGAVPSNSLSFRNLGLGKTLRFLGLHCLGEGVAVGLRCSDSEIHFVVFLACFDLDIFGPFPSTTII